MKILSVSVQNFASYESLTFKPSDRGLTLVQGPTGAGKSTLCDVVPWVLFGKTAKGGAVDEVISWNASGTTGGGIVVETANNTIQVCRSRKPNDLYYIDDKTQVATRGKDLADTQRMINELIGMDYDLYLASAYYHEFSATAQFFTANAKNRRAIFEQLTDLSLADRVTTEASKARKDLRTLKDEMTTEHKVMTAREAELTQSYKIELKRGIDWDTTNRMAINRASESMASFDDDKARNLKILNKSHKAFEADLQNQLKDLEDKIASTQAMVKPTLDIQGQKAYIQGQIDHIKNNKCETCGSPKGSDRVMVLTRELYNLEKVENDNRQRNIDVANYKRQWEKVSNTSNPYTSQIDREIARPNTHTAQVQELKAASSPYTRRTNELNEKVFTLRMDLLVLNDEIKDVTQAVNDLDVLNDVVSAFRASLLQNTIQQIQDHTNRLLVDHFDAEIKVTFSATDADKLEVEIAKDGNACEYTQLSKGQRCLLKLCFGVSVMKQVAQQHAINIDCLFFDEAFDGVDDALKLKAFGVLETLALTYPSVFCVEHNSAIKSLFHNTITVSLINGRSTLEEA